MDFSFIGSYDNKQYVQTNNWLKGPENNWNEASSPNSSAYYDMDDYQWHYDAPNLLPYNTNPNATFLASDGWPSKATYSADLYKGSGWRPVVFKDKMVYLNALPTRPSYISGSYETTVDMMGYTLLYSFDGDEAVIAHGLDVANGETGFNTSAPMDFTIDEAGAWLYVLEMDGDIFRTSDLETWAYFATAPEDSLTLEIMDGVLYVGTATSELYSMVVPEPATMTLLAIGGLAMLRKRKRKAA